MPMLGRISPTEAPDDIADLYAKVRKTIGAVPSMVTYMANSPAALTAWLGLIEALKGGSLPAAVQERLALATAEYNECSYCLSAHTFVAKNVVKMEPAEISRARDAASENPHTDAILKLSDAVARGRGNVDPTAVDDARAAGVTDGEIAEVIAHLALNTLTNYFNILVDTPNEYPELVTARAR
ncbi:carboxymuconolactone decarboxylase family protein [Sinomonas sp. JGH33]|uniref:Carboxymuconolactone decarboxylase family protein n=1 Tax=Sinomonas terricola TaxID=3110330 RepID=A0ABU5T248_9MICC|nr:carboxymuconolactone decarboxylase family protein [Sinomonas sp. JGH33]MEA5453720.1 carboxymuconolactone decarboxylase family protein [Sinomonas sp. JGH33]